MLTVPSVLTVTSVLGLPSVRRRPALPPPAYDVLDVVRLLAQRGPGGGLNIMSLIFALISVRIFRTIRSEGAARAASSASSASLRSASVGGRTEKPSRAIFRFTHHSSS